MSTRPRRPLSRRLTTTALVIATTTSLAGCLLVPERDPGDRPFDCGQCTDELDELHDAVAATGGVARVRNVAYEPAPSFGKDETFNISVTTDLTATPEQKALADELARLAWRSEVSASTVWISIWAVDGEPPLDLGDAEYQLYGNPDHADGPRGAGFP